MSISTTDPSANAWADPSPKHCEKQCQSAFEMRAKCLETDTNTIEIWRFGVENGAEMPIDVDALIRKADEMYKAIEPEDVQVVLGEAVATVRIPFVMPDEFSELTAKYPQRPGVHADFGVWFSLDDVAKNYPKIKLVDGDDEDDLRTIRGESIVYRWPEIYGALTPEDRNSVQAAIWGMHVYRPQQIKKVAGSDV